MLVLGFRRLNGFTLIEILVAMVILALGLLGLGALQMLSIRNSQDAYLYSQAMALSYEMADRIHANASAWNTDTLPTAANSCEDNCNSAAQSCSISVMASYDYCVWMEKAKAQLGPAALVEVGISPVSGSDVCTGTSAMRCLTLSWTSGSQSSAKFELELQP
ncbi:MULTISPECIES: type IV pilus modification protein PilV [Methylomicrobium]|uniref:Type IV pilus modification protein PilV n=1 Tax=Methylomicrobium album BG8 TaxID=686340 RepID=H8GK28_METAL|nr:MULTISPECIES: type IV pilus modification protein PilV [Methylomicrobium]EIC29152.1 type IV pilus modification protein PilV [Methylomicrobium album BG8]